MTIDLMVLAKETYIDVECSFGTIRVYHVPDAVLLSGSSIFSEPDPPVVIMKTVTGTQERAAKKGDPGFDEWQNEVFAIREKQFELRQARGFVMALADVDWSQYDISNPPPSKLAQEVYNGHWPENEMLQKKAWLDFTILKIREDKDKILEAMNGMNQANEPTADGVESVKKNLA
jgi:hypothetical protein